MYNRLVFLFLFIAGQALFAKAQEAVDIFFEDESGQLRYVTDTEGNHLPDFSYAGYKNGTTPIPEVAIAKTIGPIPGDNTDHIQAALDEIAAMAPDEDGIKGALLLEPGIYEISGTIVIQSSGTILRGAGDGIDSAANTILLGTGNSPAQRDIIQVGNVPGVNWSSAIPGSQSIVTSPYIPAGSRSLAVTAPELYSPGNNVIIRQTSPLPWLASIDFGATASDAPWSAGAIDVVYNRYITGVDFEEEKIVLDAPIYDHFDRALAEVEVYALNRDRIRTNIGIEDLRIEIQTDGAFDEEHARNGIRLIGVEDCWVSGITALHFIYGAVVTRYASRVTVRNAQGLAPHAEITGGRRYNFSADAYSNNILFENCLATEGRHSFVSNGTSSVSGIVFHNCRSKIDYSVSEGHRQWSQGLLFDNVTFEQSETPTLIGLYNRGDFGQSHGWSTVNSVAWNVKVPLSRQIIIQKPPGRQNYAIACEAHVTNAHQFPHPIGYAALTNETPLITSLYQQQLENRVNTGIAPDGPARLTAESTEEGVLLKWLDIASRDSAYRIEWSTDGGMSFSEIATIPADATSFLHTDIPINHGHEITYRIFALGTDGPSPYSNPASISLSTSVKTIPVPNLMVFPNPFREKIVLRAYTLPLAVEVYDSMGRLISLEKQAIELETKQWSNGTYFLRVSDTQGHVSFLQIKKQ